MNVKLVSGGVDSYIMSQEIDGINVYVDFGQPYAAEETRALHRLGVKFDIVKVSNSEMIEDGYIPCRNLFLASLVEMLYKADNIYLAGLKDDNCIDKTESEFATISDIISRYSGKRVNVTSPYWQKTKGDIIQSFAKKEHLSKTFSCYTPVDGKPCGDCPACLRRTIALETNGIDSGVILSDRILREYLSKIHTYDSDRISRFFIYLRKRCPVIALDIDGVLCHESDGFDYQNRVPQTVDTSDFGNSYIVLYTARLESDREVTLKWLEEHGVKYDCLIMNKLPYSLLIDDRAINYLKTVKE